MSEHPLKLRDAIDAAVDLAPWKAVAQVAQEGASGGGE